MRLSSSENHFPKFTKHFWSNRNYFSIDYYFHPYQTPKNAEIIFQKPFYAETNRACKRGTDITKYMLLILFYWCSQVNVERFDRFLKEFDLGGKG